VRTAPKANQRTARVPCQARKGRPHPFHPSAGKPGGDFGASGSRPACLDARLRPGPQRERAKRGDAALSRHERRRSRGDRSGIARLFFSCPVERKSHAPDQEDRLAVRTKPSTRFSFSDCRTGCNNHTFKSNTLILGSTGRD
jgi:hypothetical protein